MDSSEHQFKRPESVLVVVYTPALEFLLMQRKDQPDYWQSVTGALEPEEQAASAAARELWEETGITDARIRSTGVCNRFEITANRRHHYAPGVTHNIEHVFEACVAAAIDVRLSIEEHLAFRWLSAEAALAACWSSTNRAAIDQIRIQASSS